MKRHRRQLRLHAFAFDCRIACSRKSKPLVFTTLQFDYKSMNEMPDTTSIRRRKKPQNRNQHFFLSQIWPFSRRLLAKNEFIVGHAT